MSIAIDQLIERDLHELLGGDTPPDLQPSIVARARKGDFSTASQPEPASIGGGRLLRYLAAACAVLAIGTLAWVLWPQPLPDTVIASEGASYLVADDHIQLNKGWLLLSDGAPEVRSGAEDRILVTGRGVVGSTFPQADQLKTLADQLSLNTEERAMLGMKNRWVLSAGLALCLFSGQAVINDKPVIAEDLPGAEVIERKSGSAADVASADNAFGFKLFRQMHTEGENTLISPTSFCLALHMANEGAAGDTRSEIETAMGLEGIDSREANKALLAELNGRKGVTLNVANSLWVDLSRLSMKEGYVDGLREYFDATARAEDFSNPDTVKIINEWVAGKTNNLIRDLLDSTDPDEVAYLINAIYFKGEWTTRFDKDKTKEADFNLSDGTTKRVKLMSRGEDDITYSEDDNVQVCALPYGKDEKTAMWIVLPKEGTSLDSVVADLDAKQFATWTKSAAEKKGTLRLPRFSLDYKSLMNETLKKAGIHKAFDSDQADFTNMGTSRRNQNIYVGRVLHQTKIIVNEEGTEAAAATIVTKEEKSKRDDPFSMTCDRPFLFVIADKDTGAVLFTGTCYNPEAVK